jgi:hypothetical protein
MLTLSPESRRVYVDSLVDNLHAAVPDAGLVRVGVVGAGQARPARVRIVENLTRGQRTYQDASMVGR